MNAPDLHKKVTSDAGRAARLASGKQPPRAIVEELYLLTYSRLPTDEELAVGVSLFDGPEGRPPCGGRRPAVGIDQLGRVRLQGLIERPGVIAIRDRKKVSMSLHTNCESVTRRDCLRLGLGALIGGGLIDALRLRGEAAARRAPGRRAAS